MEVNAARAALNTADALLADAECGGRNPRQWTRDRAHVHARIVRLNLPGNPPPANQLRTLIEQTNGLLRLARSGMADPALATAWGYQRRAAQDALIDVLADADATPSPATATETRS